MENSGSFFAIFKINKTNMKKVFLLLLVTLSILSCCNTKKTATIESKNNQPNILTPCPEGYVCSFETHHNKSMVVKTDDIGATYYELEDNTKKTVYHYTYKLKTDQQYQDAGYREEIIFELDSKTKDLKLSNEELQNAKMLFGVWCYCKGKAGNYKITKGNFTKKGNEISIDFPAIVSDQKVTELKIKI